MCLALAPCLQQRVLVAGLPTGGDGLPPDGDVRALAAAEALGNGVDRLGPDGAPEPGEPRALQRIVVLDGPGRGAALDAGSLRVREHKLEGLVALIHGVVEERDGDDLLLLARREREGVVHVHVVLARLGAALPGLVVHGDGAGCRAVEGHLEVDRGVHPFFGRGVRDRDGGGPEDGRRGRVREHLPVARAQDGRFLARARATAQHGESDRAVVCGCDPDEPPVRAPLVALGARGGAVRHLHGVVDPGVAVDEGFGELEVHLERRPVVLCGRVGAERHRERGGRHRRARHRDGGAGLEAPAVGGADRVVLPAGGACRERHRHVGVAGGLDVDHPAPVPVVSGALDPAYRPDGPGGGAEGVVAKRCVLRLRGLAERELDREDARAVVVRGVALEHCGERSGRRRGGERVRRVADERVLHLGVLDRPAVQREPVRRDDHRARRCGAAWHRRRERERVAHRARGVGHRDGGRSDERRDRGGAVRGNDLDGAPEANGEREGVARIPGPVRRQHRLDGLDAGRVVGHLPRARVVDLDPSDVVEDGP